MDRFVLLSSFTYFESIVHVVVVAETEPLLLI